MTAIANARMYAVSTSAAAAWDALFAAVVLRSGVTLAITAYPPPGALAGLWARDDLGCVFMCGWPFIREGGTKTVLAAPVPNADWAEDRPQYRSAFIVRADAPFGRLEDAFGHRFAFNSRDSHSGTNAPRAHLAKFADGRPLFASVVGPLVTHQRVVGAVAEGEAELAAIDSFTMSLLRRHDPTLVAGVRVLGFTAPCPIPALVANALSAEAVDAVRGALLGLDGDVAGRALLEAVCLRRFSAVAPTDYAATMAMERSAIDAGYPEIL